MLTHGNLKVLISALVLISNIIYEVKYFHEFEFDYLKYYGCFALTVPERITIPFDRFAIKNGIVIGNIHDNHELLQS